MADLTVHHVPHIAVEPAAREGQQRGRAGQRRERRPAKRREAVAGLLREHGVEAPADLIPVLELIERKDTGELFVRIWDQASGALLVEVPAQEFADEAAAYHLLEGLLVERTS